MSSSEASAEHRVVVVDDSAFMRRVISDMIARFPGYQVVGTASDGREALEVVAAKDPDVVTLDIEMPRLDGFGVLREIMSSRPRAVVVLSAYTPEGSRGALRALDLGAVDFVAKPSGPISLDFGVVEGRLYQALEAAVSADISALTRGEPAKAAGRLEAPAIGEATVVAIAASTGGPRALSSLLTGLPADLGAAVLIVQHMPPGFTATLAARLNNLTPWPVSEAQGGEEVIPNRVWIAPGDFHMRVRRVEPSVRIALDQREPIWGSRPAADALFLSVAEVYSCRTIGVVLTGMGRDGTDGLAAIREAGGRTLAQDRSTSVVFGMPGQAVARGVVEREVPLPELPAAIVECLRELTVGSNREHGS